MHNHRLVWLLAFINVALLGLLFLSGATSAPLQPQTPPPNTTAVAPSPLPAATPSTAVPVTSGSGEPTSAVEVVRAKRIEIVDEKGHVIFRVSAEGKAGVVVLQDTDARPLVSLLRGTDGGGCVRIHDEKGGIAIDLSSERLKKLQDDNKSTTKKPVGPLVETGKFWISEVTDDGAYVKLDNGSLWRVESIDRFESTIWLAVDEVVVVESNESITGYKLVNTSQKSSVDAKQVAK